MSKKFQENENGLFSVEIRRDHVMDNAKKKYAQHKILQSKVKYLPAHRLEVVEYQQMNNKKLHDDLNIKMSEQERNEVFRDHKKIAAMLNTDKKAKNSDNELSETMKKGMGVKSASVKSIIAGSVTTARSKTPTPVSKSKVIQKSPMRFK